jgi:site-specific DNA-adenine methylase
MIKSPLRYPGGKSRIAKIIVKNFPNFAEYREPFLGGGSVFIETKQQFPDKKFWINDAYFDLFKFWEQSQIDVETLQNKIIELNNTISEFLDCLDNVNKSLWDEKIQSIINKHNKQFACIDDNQECETQCNACKYVVNRVHKPTKT